MATHNQPSATDAPAAKRSPLAWVFVGVVRFYQLVISPIIGPSCRFKPTCSHYALEAIGRFGALKGGWLAAKRIGKCHPWGGFGFDPVPKGCNMSEAHADDKEIKTDNSN